MSSAWLALRVDWLKDSTRLIVSHLIFEAPSMFTPLTSVIVPAKSSHTHSIIWLHGLGADGHDFEGIVSDLELSVADHIRFVFPHAPVRPVTVNGGVAMRAWYDIVEMSLERQPDLPAIRESTRSLHTLIEQEKKLGIATGHILLAGFSQGGVIALHAGLTYPEKLAGILALSAYLPTLGQLATESTSTNKNIPIFMGHGILDSVVPVEEAKAAYDGLQNLGYSVDWRDYVMEHSVCVEEIQHINEFINRIFSV